LLSKGLDAIQAFLSPPFAVARSGMSDGCRHFAGPAHPVLEALAAIVGDEKQEIAAPSKTPCRRATGKGDHGITVCSLNFKFAALFLRTPRRGRGGVRHRNITGAWNVRLLCGT